ncbi:MAG TPA: hypothetical protein VG870_14465 [Chitinophagaceae bacterium]|nr:hypothetical protein [Chitinophagaceae bacterium]
MSTLVVTLLLLLFLSLAIGLLVFIHHRDKQRDIADLVSQLSWMGQAGSSYSGHELLTGCAIGLNGPERKLVIVQRIHRKQYERQLVELDQVIRCGVQKTYLGAKGPQPGAPAGNPYTEAIELVLEFRDGRQPARIPFFRYMLNNGQEAEALEQRAHNWKVILSKLIG